MELKVLPHPAQVIIAPTSQRIRLMPLLPVIAKIFAGATKMPVPIILFNINALPCGT
jgi:hypothetical protein